MARKVSFTALCRMQRLRNPGDRVCLDKEIISEMRLRWRLKRSCGLISLRIV